MDNFNHLKKEFKDKDSSEELLFWLRYCERFSVKNSIPPTRALELLRLKLNKFLMSNSD